MEERTMNYFKPDMSPAQVNKISMLGLAHIGDAVYELMVRASLCESGHTAVYELHHLATGQVNAPAQARAAEKILPMLDPDEAAIYRRGRNAHVNSVPHGSGIGQYHAATGLEALFGWLYLLGRTDRLAQLFSVIKGGASDRGQQEV